MALAGVGEQQEELLAAMAREEGRDPARLGSAAGALVIQGLGENAEDAPVTPLVLDDTVAAGRIVVEDDRIAAVEPEPPALSFLSLRPLIVTKVWTSLT